MVCDRNTLTLLFLAMALVWVRWRKGRSSDFGVHPNVVEHGAHTLQTLTVGTLWDHASVNDKGEY